MNQGWCSVDRVLVVLAAPFCALPDMSENHLPQCALKSRSRRITSDLGRIDGVRYAIIRDVMRLCGGLEAMASAEF